MLLFMQHDFRYLTGSKKHGNPSEANFHELSVDAVHIGIRKAVLVISIADSVDPRHCRHVAEQQHPLKEWLLSLMTTCDRDQSKVWDLYKAWSKESIWKKTKLISGHLRKSILNMQQIADMILYGIVFAEIDSPSGYPRCRWVWRSFTTVSVIMDYGLVFWPEATF